MIGSELKLTLSLKKKRFIGPYPQFESIRSIIITSMIVITNSLPVKKLTRHGACADEALCCHLRLTRGSSSLTNSPYLQISSDKREVGNCLCPWEGLGELTGSEFKLSIEFPMHFPECRFPKFNWPPINHYHITNCDYNFIACSEEIELPCHLCRWSYVLQQSWVKHKEFLSPSQSLQSYR